MNELVKSNGFMRAQNIQDAKEVATIMVESGFIPDFHYKAKNPVASVLMCLQKGFEVGLSPTQAVQDIANINGRPVIWGDAALALCKISPDYEYVVETFDETTKTATCKAKRKGEPEVVRSFSHQDGIKAGLSSRPIWRLYEERMLQMRARGFCIRDTWPHVLKGLHFTEEYVGVRNEIHINPIDQTITLEEKSPLILQKENNVVESIKSQMRLKNQELKSEPTAYELERARPFPPEGKVRNPEVLPIPEISLPITTEISEPPTMKIKAVTMAKLMHLFKSYEIDEATIQGWLDRATVEKLDELTEIQGNRLIEHLERKARELNKD